ncbi:carboxypeptidase-like regulatory domain-containing protein [Salmonirosea aquatica]|uniref:Carboxypeptidase regulatory-like domain-containing protein n=1 Tax=Salmonirosea aquatica TaxID=2654236 RepID=A0A7C9FFN3_9BACT|nr:carboxypeptidase regulatory-like domain-containing protein [Cytophagaceae bacterium SJW1-29]
MNTLRKLRYLLIIPFFLTGTLLLNACESDAADPGPGDAPSDSGKAGYLVGTVTDPQGNPLSRATVYTDNTVFKGRGAEVSTTANGTYQILLVKDLGQWVAKGYLLKQYNDRIYKISLHPENPDSFSENEKPVRNFQWKLTGHVPDLSLDLYYGGTVELFRDPNVTDLDDNENIEFTFTPVGPLIDGSTGKTLTLRMKKRYDSFLRDVPIGRYAITAVYKPTGEKLQVSDAFEGSEYASSVTVDFVGRESATRANMLGIGYTNR